MTPPTSADASTGRPVTVNGGVSLGMLSGGAIIAVLGAGTTMRAAGSSRSPYGSLLVARATLVRRRGTDQPLAPANANRQLSTRVHGTSRSST